jgi:hypothetical protein
MGTYALSCSVFASKLTKVKFSLEQAMKAYRGE